MSDFLLGLGQVWPYLAVVFLLLFVLVLVLLSGLVKSSKPAPSITGAGAPPPPDPKEEKKPAKMPPLVGGASLHSSFARAVAFLRSNVAGRDYRYQIPWFLLLGAPGSGKTTLLSNTGVPVSFDRHSGHDPLEWRFFDRGILLGVPGDFIREEGRGGDSREWNRLMRLLSRYRPRRPADGVVLLVSATDLVGEGALDEPALGRVAITLADRLGQAQKILGLTFPVYVIVTKCDEIPGFGALARELPAMLRDAIFGWSNPYHLDAAFSAEWIDEAMESASRNIDVLASEILVERSGLPHADELFLFSERFETLRSPLRILLGRLFRETAYREGVHLRGVYFTGDGADALQAGQMPNLLPEPEPSPFELAMREAEPQRARQNAAVQLERPKVPIFLKDLFETKIFAEHGLARPLAGVALSRNRTVLAIQATAASLTLVLGVGFWLGYRRLVDERSRLEPMLRQIVNMPRTPERERHNLLLTMAQAGDVRFRSAFLPSSMFTATERNITEVMTAACTHWVFTNLAQSLERRVRDFIDTPPPKQPETDEVVLFADVQSTPEYQELEKFVAGLQRLKENVDIYEDLRQPGRVEEVERIRKLVRYLYNQEVPEVEPNGHFARALEVAQGPAFSVPSRDREQATERMKQMVAQLFEKWFGNSLLMNDVAELKDRLAGLEQGRAAGYTELKTALDALKQVDANLGSPKFAWVANPRLDLMGTFRRVIQDPVETSRLPWLSPDVTDYSRRLGEEYLNTLRNDLAAQRSGLTGPIIEVRETVQLSSGARALELALENAMNLRFMSLVPTRTMRLTVEPSSRLLWRIEPLQEAVRLNEIYTRFVDEGLSGSPERLRFSLARVALDRMKLNAEDLIAQAQDVQPRPLTRDGAASEDATLAEVNAFRTAVEPLVQLATRFGKLGVIDLQNKILRVLTVQSVNMLQTLENKLNDENPYVAKGSSFGWWDGRGSLSLTAFDAANANALGEYLTAQRERIKFLSQQADPFVRFLEVWFPTRGEAQTRLLTKWQRLIADFRQYEGKRPGASVTALEEFITAEMDKITPENACKAAPVPRPQDGDYFTQVRANLRNAVVQRCEQLSASSVFDLYNEIATQFNNTLAGRFPFANLGPSQAVENEAAPEAVLEFYKVLDRSGKAARGTLRENARFGASAQEALRFLDQMEDLRPFITAATPEAEKEPPFTFDFLPKFRVNQAAEVKGNQIIEWTMQVGGQIWRQGEPDHPGRWRPGNPIRLSLRFAKESPDFPVRDASQPNLRIRGERNAFFEYTNRWSLLALLRRQEAPAAEMGRAPDLKPYTLKMRLKTERDTRWPSEGGDGSQAVVYVNFRLTAPGGKVAAVLPPFPVRAPRLDRPTNQ